MNEDNYRGTGKSKTECQVMVDAVIERFKQEHPGKEVPLTLVNWVENIATEQDVAEARKRMHPFLIPLLPFEEDLPHARES